MNTKVIIGIVIAVLVLAGAYLLFMKPDGEVNPAMEQTGNSAPLETTNPNVQTTTTSTTTTTSGTTNSGTSVGVTTGLPVTVTYTNTGFSPKSISVAVGTTVHFVNASSHSMWVASDVHPSHTAYDGTNLQQHCATGTSFDECKAVNAGATYNFTFSKAGSFSYHNHLQANDTGSVVVK